MYRIIFIDDEPSGFFSDGREAWEAIEGGLAPAVIVTDIQMPEFSGTELIDLVRREGLEAELVIISAYRDFREAEKMIREARLALEGDFSYAVQEQTAIIQYYLANHYQERISMKELAEHLAISLIELRHQTEKNSQIGRKAAGQAGWRHKWENWYFIWYDMERHYLTHGIWLRGGATLR